jgi:hypothetical protein
LLAEITDCTSDSRPNGLTIKPWRSYTTGAEENDGNKIKGTLRTVAETIDDVSDAKSKWRWRQRDGQRFAFESGQQNKSALRSIRRNRDRQVKSEGKACAARENGKEGRSAPEGRPVGYTPGQL